MIQLSVDTNYLFRGESESEQNRRCRQLNNIIRTITKIKSGNAGPALSKTGTCAVNKTGVMGCRIMCIQMLLLRAMHLSTLGLTHI